MSGARWKAAAVLVATFLVGGVAGGAAMRAWSDRRMGRAFRESGPEARHRFLLEAMSRRLDLSDEQQAEIERIHERHRGERDRILEKCRPAHRKLQRAVESEIRAVLTPEQRRLYRRLKRRHGKHPPPWHGPPPE